MVFFFFCGMMSMNDSFLLQVSDSNLQRNWLPIRIIIINPEPCERCRCRAAMFWIDGSAMISEEQSLTPGLRLRFPTVSFFFNLNFENGRGQVALISKAVASPFSYRRGEGKKRKKRRCNELPRGFGPSKTSVYIGNWKFVFDRPGCVSLQRKPTCLPVCREKAAKNEKDFVITTL